MCVDSKVTQITGTAFPHHQPSAIYEPAIVPMSEISTPQIATRVSTPQIATRVSTPQIATRESKVQVSYGTILHEEQEQPKRNI